MPVAEKFNALGAGNGFMSCLPKVNISFRDHWTTCSGFNKDSVGPVTQSDIEESRRLASLFYWNSYKLDVTQTNIGIPTSFPQGANAEDDAKKYVSGSPVAQDPLTPKSRVCRTDNYINAGGDPFDEDDEYIYIEPFSIIRMYDGVTTSEDNFVGFGLNFFAIEVVDNVGEHFLYLGGFGGLAYDYTAIPIVGSTDTLHCVCNADGSSGEERELDPVNRKVRTYDDPPTFFDLVTQIHSIELYTYPT